jgi:hypothetical protein
MMNPIRFSTCALCYLVLGSVVTPANATLTDNGNGLIYDSDLNITWLFTDTLDTLGTSNPGIDDWQTAKNWADNLVYAGQLNWRLPSTLIPDATCQAQSSSIGTGCTGSELGHLFYTELGGTAGVPLSSALLGLDYAPYWSETIVNSGYAYRFYFGGIPGYAGYQEESNQALTAGAIAVHAGNISAVPLPAAAWLFCSGLFGLLGIGCRKTA